MQGFCWCKDLPTHFNCSSSTRNRTVTNTNLLVFSISTPVNSVALRLNQQRILAALKTFFRKSCSNMALSVSSWLRRKCQHPKLLTLSLFYASLFSVLSAQGSHSSSSGLFAGSVDKRHEASTHLLIPVLPNLFPLMQSTSSKQQFYSISKQSQ